MRTNDIAQTLVAAATVSALAGNLAANAAQTSPSDAGIVPKPVKVEMGTGSFRLSPQARILCQEGSPGAQAAASYLVSTWEKDFAPLPEISQFKPG
jgi:hypothetical protein